MFAYVGSRTTRERHARGEGISVYCCDPDRGVLTRVQVHGDLVNPSFLALNRAATRLYTVHGDGHEVSAFEVHPETGHIALLNRQSTKGQNPVHLALDPHERFMVVSNHLSSSLSVLSMEDDGALGALVQQVTIDAEPGPHRKEQPFAKPHFNPFDPSGRFVVVPDKGSDQTWVYRFEAGRLHLVASSGMTGREGSGPRHLAFHPHQPLAYVANELDSTVTACRFDAHDGRLVPFQILSTLADSYTGNSRASEIEVDRAGRTVYFSNRGEDSIAVLRIDPRNGRLRLVQTQPTLGRTPRFFTLSPNGRWLYVLNEDSDSIVVMRVDETSGELAPTPLRYDCGSPVCMVFAA